jgi:hypothetical protein
MWRAHPGQTPGHNLAALGNELPEQPHVFVINVIDFFDAELAHLLAPEKLATAIAARTARPAISTRSVRPSAFSSARTPRHWCRTFLIYLVSHNSPSKLLQ